ncbi:hypothetical protein UFOVP1217_116 [uncultured Caudovirales phage]|uniref:Uncharacterized protein n=1 Tax=uncultured Caudovirales phage TaxID=2100421 RepID=A0A6J5RIY3_9CAUD|nr:hypothetical protein UFOVP465_6 [uncultured Caudovirales phage]CAB4156279.1 hypothetical protein UFOVP666_52 [uncultured Caudovirales phage]CAB4160322.1 hypothetical protein UFOVP727_129 [uncultured Caudovirales phage]CAB4164729.1 hypothetical protein UFOVP819_80 [uncultured Caudovirales phage]CAB4171665.1 hypothetical protein UFOVP926_7 [uncultured Caudovirales phage]
MEYSGNSSQEAFVLEMLGHKKNGFYVELGAFHSSEGSNTYELEKTYDWQGVSFELLEQRRNEFIANRTNPCMGDALNFDYIAYFENNHFPKQIDYLQVDIDTGYDRATRPNGNHYTTLLGLITIPLTQYRFSVITFEHDANMYFRNAGQRDAQREILDCLDYTLVARTIHEDWWVDSSVISPDVYKKEMRWETL